MAFYITSAYEESMLRLFSNSVVNPLPSSILLDRELDGVFDALLDASSVAPPGIYSTNRRIQVSIYNG